MIFNINEDIFKSLLAPLLPARSTPLGTPLLRNDPASGKSGEPAWYGSLSVSPFESGLAGMGSFLPNSHKGRVGGIYLFEFLKS
jgi:hypothetical protein